MVLKQLCHKRLGKLIENAKKGKSYRRAAGIKKEVLIKLKRYLEEMGYNGYL